MNTVRASIKILAFIIFTITSCLIYLILYSFLKLLRFPYEPLRNWYMRSWSKGSARIFNFRVEFEGKPPKEPFFLVCNHLSYLDIIPLYFYLNCTFVAKKEVRSWPVLGFLVYMMGVIFIDRKNKGDVVRVNKILTESLNKYQGIVIFPEGTSTGGKSILPFKSSLLEYPSSQNLDVYVASIHYKTSDRDPDAVDSVCFFGARQSFPNHVFLMAKNHHIDCRINFNEEPVKATNRKELAEKLHQRMMNQFIQTDLAD